MKKSGAWIMTILVCLLVLFLVLVFLPSMWYGVISYTGAGLAQFVWNLAPVFLCVGLMDVWVEKDEMMGMMGNRSGVSGAFLSLFMGMLTAVPVYALLPITGLLLKKGGRISNVLIFLCSSVSIRVPLLLFEISSLGLRFAASRFILNLAVVFVIAYSIEGLLPEQEMGHIYRKNKNESGQG